MNKSVKQTSLKWNASKVTEESRTRGHEAFYTMLNHDISNRRILPDNRYRLMSNGRPTDFTAGFFPSTQFKPQLDTGADECSASFSIPSGLSAILPRGRSAQWLTRLFTQSRSFPTSTGSTACRLVLLLHSVLHIPYELLLVWATLVVSRLIYRLYYNGEGPAVEHPEQCEHRVDDEDAFNPAESRRRIGFRTYHNMVVPYFWKM